MCIFLGVLLALNSFLWMTMHKHIGALIVDKYMESEDIQPMAWPANSPDLNPIEHAWDALGRAIVMHHLPPRIILELKIALVEEWKGLPQALR